MSLQDAATSKDCNPLIEWTTAPDGRETVSLPDTLGWVVDVMRFMENSMQSLLEGNHAAPNYAHNGNAHHIVTRCLTHAIERAYEHAEEDEKRMREVVAERDALLARIEADLAAEEGAEA